MAKKEKEVKKNSYFKEMKAELKKVVWPTPKELFNNTVAVIAFVLIVAVIVFIFDVCFDSLNKYGITKLQEKVQTSLKNEDKQNEEDNSSEENKQENNTDAEVSTDTNVVLENATVEQNSEVTENENAEKAEETNAEEERQEEAVSEE